MYNDEFNQYHYSRGDIPRDDYHSDYRYEQPREQGKPDKKKGGKGRIVALLLVCAILGGLCGFGGAALYRSGVKHTATLQQSNREAVAVTVKQVDGKTLMTPAEVYAATVNSVVSINSTSRSTNFFGQSVPTASSGSGFIISADGYIITNEHVVSGATEVKVTLYNGETYTAAYVGGDSDYDVAVIKIEASGLDPVVLGDSAKLNVGDSVLAIGNPLGELTFSMSQGIVSCCNRAINVDGTPFNMIQTDAGINPGNSGGPLMNLYGEVIGIVSAKYSSYSNTAVEALGFAIPMADVQAILTDIMENGTVTNKAYMAITAGSMTEEMAAQYRIDLTEGVFVFSVEKGGAGDKAGLRLGDIITKMDNRDIRDYDDLTTAKKNYHAGDAVTLTIYRQGEYMTVQLTFDEQPATTGTQEQTPAANEDPYGSYGGQMPGMDDFFNYFFGRNW